MPPNRRPLCVHIKKVENVMDSMDALLNRINTYAKEEGPSANPPVLSKGKRDEILENMDRVKIPKGKKGMLKKALISGDFPKIGKIESVMMNILHKKRIHPPVTEKEIEKAERTLGFPLPAILRRMYLEIGNGGFGPGCGLLPLWKKGIGQAFEESIVSLYAVYRTDDPECPRWKWPEGMLPLCHWGDAIHSCADCLHDPFPVYRTDPEALYNGDPNGMKVERPSIYDWLKDMAENKLAF
jgi:hypothetical protein